MILSEKASKKIVSIMVTNNKIDNNLSEAYEYCIDFALDLIFFNLSLLIAGLITHNFILSVIYVFMLVPVKMLAGGAHASSPISCFILSVICPAICTRSTAKPVSEAFCKVTVGRKCKILGYLCAGKVRVKQHISCGLEFLLHDVIRNCLPNLLME